VQLQQSEATDISLVVQHTTIAILLVSKDSPVANKPKAKFVTDYAAGPDTTSHSQYVSICRDKNLRTK